MISKERVLTVLEHKPADRVPVTNRYTPEIASELARIVGVSSRDSFDLEVALGHDMLCMKEIGIVNSYNIIIQSCLSRDLFSGKSRSDNSNLFNSAFHTLY